MGLRLVSDWISGVGDRILGALRARRRKYVVENLAIRRAEGDFGRRVASGLKKG